MYYSKLSAFLTILFTCLFYTQCIGQVEEESPAIKEDSREESFRPHHVLSLIITHANVREGVSEGSKRWLSLPAWGVNYDFRFHKRWSIGLHTDLIVEEFKVIRHIEAGDKEGEVIDRNFPVAPAIMTSFIFGKRKRAAVSFGPGVEFDGGETFFLTRAGIEYAFELRKGWELLAEFVYDVKWDGYDSLAFGLGVGYAFGHHKKEKE